MTKGLSKHLMGLLAIGLLLLGFTVMYWGVRNSCPVWSVIGLTVTGVAALVVVRRF